MKEKKNINHFLKLLGNHYNGSPWIDTTILETLKSLTAEEAARKINGLNSAWQIVNHILGWRNALIARVMDSPLPHPENNFFGEINDTSEKAWKDTLKKFEKSQQDIITFLSLQDDNLLEKISPSSGYSYFELVSAILIHDSYHLGQIVLIKKLLKK